MSEAKQGDTRSEKGDSVEGSASDRQDELTGERTDELTLEEKLERLSEIVSLLEAQDLELDRALELFEEGVRHIREAEELLSRAELRVEELVGDGEEARTRPLDGESGGEGEEET